MLTKVKVTDEVKNFSVFVWDNVTFYYFYSTKQYKHTLIHTTMKSFFNEIMSQTVSMPVVGEGATVLLYSDRHAYEVISVDEDKKGCTIQRYSPKRIDNTGMGDCQEYEYKELTEEKLNLRFRHGGWVQVYKVIEFTDEYKKACTTTLAKGLTPEQRAIVYPDNSVQPRGVLEGITKEVNRSSKLSIIFGVKKEYYDFTI